MNNNKIIIWASVAHNPDLHDLPFQNYLRNSGFEVHDVSINSPANSNNLILILKFLYTFFRRINQITIWQALIFCITAKNIQLKKRIIYSLQFSQIYHIYKCHKKNNKIHVVFRGNNLPNIALVKKHLKHAISTIIPHGLYFQPPPENKFYLSADNIITGTSTWPEQSYSGTVHKLGMIENRKLTSCGVFQGEVCSICTTHSREVEAKFISKLAEICEQYYELCHVRVHPRNQELKKLIKKQKFINNKMDNMPISEYLPSCEILIFPVGYNDRISNVFYEAILMNKNVLICAEDPSKIVNLPLDLEKYVVDINDIEKALTDYRFQHEIVLSGKEHVFQADDIFEKIVHNCFKG
jgi:hypothetical protein